MQEDLLIVLLCELGERILAMRELLAEPSVAAKPHTSAVSALLGQGLGAVEERLWSDVAAPLLADDTAASTHTESLVMSALDDCGRALRVLHRRLGLLDLRWGAAPVDIFLRKLRDDTGELPHPAVVLCDDYTALDDVAQLLGAELDEAGVPAPGEAAGAPVIALPRLEANNPLSWPLLLPSLVRLHTRQAGSAAGDHHGALPHDLESAGAVRLGGPAAFAAQAAYALITTPVERAAWPALAPLAVAAADDAGGLEEQRETREGFGFSGAVAFFTRLVRARDEMLGHATSHPLRGFSAEALAALELPAPALPGTDETDVLVAKLLAGTPINAVEPPLPPDFVARLDAVRDPAGLYELLEPLNERPASLAAILGAGWLYKIGHGYPLFGELLRAEGSLRAALDAYRPHMIERNELLLQSIEAAHVQSIFAQGRLDG